MTNQIDGTAYEAARLVADNPVLPRGTIMIEHDTGKAKRGDGVRKWNNLPYWSPNGIDTYYVTRSGGYDLAPGQVPKYHVNQGATIGYFDQDGSLFLGRNLCAQYPASSGHITMPDFHWNPREMRLYLRNISMGMIADPCDINLRRWGPGTGFPYGNGSAADGTFASLSGLGANDTIGQVRFTPAEVSFGGDQNTQYGAPATTSCVLLTAKTADMPRRVTADNQTSTGGKFVISIAPKNFMEDKRRDYFAIMSEGHVQIGEAAINETLVNANLRIRAHDGTDCHQRITISGTPTGGSYTLTYYPIPVGDAFSVAETTAAIAYNAVDTDIQTALEGLASIAPGDVTVTTISAGTVFNVQFTGTMAGSSQYLMSKTSSLTGGTSDNVATSFQTRGAGHGKDRTLLSMRHAASHTGDYLLIEDGDGTDILKLDVNEDLTHVGGNYVLGTAGKGIKIKEGSNAKMGVATLVGGSAVVSTTAVAATSRVFLTSQADGGTPGWLRVSTRTAATSFTITSSSGTDTSTVAWLILDPS